MQQVDNTIRSMLYTHLSAHRRALVKSVTLEQLPIECFFKSLKLSQKARGVVVNSAFR